MFQAQSLVIKALIVLFVQRRQETHLTMRYEDQAGRADGTLIHKSTDHRCLCQSLPVIMNIYI